MIKAVLAITLFILIAAAHADSSCTTSASLNKRVGGDWTDEQGHYFSTIDLTVINVGQCDITAIQVRFTLPTGAVITQAWNLDLVDTASSIYSVSGFGNSLPPGATFTAARMTVQYSGSVNVVVSVYSQNCPSCQAPASSPTAPLASTPTSFPVNTTVNPVLLNELITAPTEVDRLRLLNASQFVFDFLNSVTGLSRGGGGRTVSATRNNFAAIVGHGIAMTVGYIGACSINLPHTHPRATEINFIVAGAFQVGFFQENGARFIGNFLTPGMATIFPQGAIHFEINLSCEPGIFVAAFNNEDPGVQTTANTFFGLPFKITQVSLNISSIQTVEDLAAHLPANPALGVQVQECIQRCGL